MVVGRRVVADLLERGDRRQHLALAGIVLVGAGARDERVEDGLVEADLLRGHRAVVELVDPVGKLGRDDRLVLGAAEHEDAVQRPQGALALAAVAVTGARQLRDERVAGADEARVGEVQDGVEVAEAVLDRRPREGDPRPGRDAPQLLGGVVGRVLDGLGLVQDDALPRDLLELVDVADGRAVGGDDDVGLGDLALDAVTAGSTRAVVDHDLEIRREPPGLRGPVADDRRRCHDERRPAAGRGLQVGEHRGRLAETHVEGEAPAEIGRIEEAEPGQGLALVRPQIAVEPLGGRRRLRGDGGGPSQQVGGPPAAFDADPALERRALEPERVAQHLRARELGGRGPLGQRSGRRLEVGMIELDPATTRADQGPGFGGEAGDVGGGQLDIVEQRRPADVGELLRADHRLGLGVRHHPQRRRRPTHRQRRHPDVEAGRHEHRAGLGHELPGLGLAEDDLAPTVAAGPAQRREQPLEPRELLLERFALLAGVDHRDLDGLEPVVLGRGEHRQVPGPALVGGVELHDEADDVLRRDGLGPPLEVTHELGTEPGRRLEGTAVEAPEEGLGHVGAGAGTRWRCGDLDPLRGIPADGVDHARERRPRDGAGVDGRVDGGHRAGHRRGDDLHAGRVDERRGPSDRVGAAAVVAAPVALALLHERDDRTLHGEVHRPDGDPAQPAQAGADGHRGCEDRSVRGRREPGGRGILGFGQAGGLGTGRDEPTEDVADRRDERIGERAVGQRHRCVRTERGAGCTGRVEQLTEVVVARRGDLGPRRPDHDVAGRPGGLEGPHAEDRRVVHLDRGEAAGGPLCVEDGIGFAGEAGERRAQAHAPAVEVGDDLVALGTGERLDRGEAPLGLDDQILEQVAPGIG